jgi:hypothetical protein
MVAVTAIATRVVQRRSLVRPSSRPADRRDSVVKVRRGLQACQELLVGGEGFDSHGG